ncbi:MAG: SCO family protein [Cytophagales bacterium]|nr:SCO family protein [Bernardetiaceae bacterium]MDW8211069.1 SCO family protein [Cytophagales bacterium]
MNKKALLKAGALIVILVLPVLVFFFLRGFGENQYALPILNPASADCPPNKIDSIHRVPSFSFLNQDSAIFTDRDLEGKIYVADFFFTRCPDICLAMSSELARVQEAIKNYPEVVILSHTVDPLYDRAHVLKAYAKQYGAIPGKWIFLTGDKAAIYHQARCGYFIATRPASSDTTIDFIHSDKFVLVDKEKRIRGYYSGTRRQDVDRLITEIQVLLAEYKNKTQ